MIGYSRDDLFLVTGASSGIGKAIACQLHQLGASVLAVSRRLSELPDDSMSSQSGSRFHCEQRDLSQDVEALPEWVLEQAGKYGKFKGFVHAAGMLSIQPIQFESLADARALFEINYFSAMSLVKGLVSGKARSESLSIVFVSSVAAVTGNAAIAMYSGSKAALNGSVRSLAKELGRHRIRVNAILPGTTDTDMLKTHSAVYSDAYLETVKARTALGGIGSPEAVANLAVFLLSDKASWITGQSIVIDGGESL